MNLKFDLQYGKMAKSCQICGVTFSLTQTKRQCVLCGSALCARGDSRCSTMDLLVYVPDQSEPGLPPKAEVAIVKIVGVSFKLPNSFFQIYYIALYSIYTSRFVQATYNNFAIDLYKVNENNNKLDFKIKAPSV